MKSPDGYQDSLELIADRILKTKQGLFSKRCVKIRKPKSPDGYQDSLELIADRILKTQESFIFKTLC
jgi:hypothetical protein